MAHTAALAVWAFDIFQPYTRGDIVARKTTLPVGEVGYVGLSDLFTNAQGWACVAMAFEESPKAIHGEAFEVQRNPRTFELEVKIPNRVKIPRHPEGALNPSAWGNVILVDEQGKRYKTTPKKFR